MPKEKKGEKNKDTLVIQELGQPSRDQSYRHSLQPKSAIVETTNLRHTRSQNYGKKKKKVTTSIPDIPEVEGEEVKMDVVKEHVKLAMPGDKERKHSRHSKGSRKNSQTSGFDNVAFEGDGDRMSRGGSSAPNSIRSSLRDPSVQSLSVVREQYCCCTKWTPCERALFALVGVLVFIIIILVVAVVVVAVRDDGDGTNSTKSFLNSFLDV